MRAALVAVALVAGALWVIALVAISTDYHDADGFTDCWPSCSVLQHSVGVLFFGAPALVVAVLLLAGLVGVVRRVRAHKKSAP